MTRVFPQDLDARFGTRAIHAGQRPDPLAGAIMSPVYLTSTYVQDALGSNKGYEYARGKNPTREALERNVAALEGGTHGFAFASGMGCVDSIMKLFRSGDHVVCAENVYGGTFRLFEQILKHFGLRFTFVDTRDPQRVEDARSDRTVAMLVETPSNPLMRLTDLRAISEIAHRAGALLIVDNTFATPFFQRPFEFGADVVYHSTTKYLNGHSDMIGGLAVVRDDALAERLQFIHNAAGAVAGPFDSWLALRGTKTLHLRMPRHDANGRRVAAWLVERVGERCVYYPGLASHPQHALAARQMSGFGGMVSVELGTRARAAHVLGSRPRLLVGRIAGRRGKPHQPPVVDDSCLRAGRPPRGAGAQRRHDPTLVRRRGRRRSDRRSRLRIRRTDLALSAFGSVSLPAFYPQGHGSDTTPPDLLTRVGAPGRSRGPQHAARDSRVRRAGAQSCGVSWRAGTCGTCFSPTRFASDRASAPQLDALYTEVLATFDWQTRPQLYVTQTPFVNAGAVGFENPFIIVNSGTLALLDREERRDVLAHELGHIISGHVTYRTIALILINFGLRNLPFLAGVALLPIQVALFEWFRTSELSSDRAGLLGTQDVRASLSTYLKLAGGPAGDDTIDLDEFLKQADEYETTGGRAGHGMEGTQHGLPRPPIQHRANRRAAPLGRQ